MLEPRLAEEPTARTSKGSVAPMSEVGTTSTAKDSTNRTAVTTANDSGSSGCRTR